MQVIVGIIINTHQQILIAQRPLDKYKGGLWEFPGGKIEPNEEPFQALKRELFEEIGIDVFAAESWLLTEYDYGDRKVFLHVWLVKQFSGEPHGKEGQPIRWILTSELDQYEFPEGNRKIIDEINNKSILF